jgi:hypothetical protein
MNIYLVSQDKNQDYDTFDAFVCYANNEEEAKQMHPSGTPLKDIDYTSDWVSNPEDVTVELIGHYEKEDLKVNTILASFNAG